MLTEQLAIGDKCMQVDLNVLLVARELHCLSPMGDTASFHEILKSACLGLSLPDMAWAT